MHVATNVLPHVMFVFVLRIIMVTVPQLSLALGVPKSNGRPAHSFVALAGQRVKLGGVVSMVAMIRSEERRVGKECRSRYSPDHSKEMPHVRFVFVLKITMLTVPQL